MGSQGHRLLVFVTTSKASVLKMLEIDMDFAKKVAVPGVSTLRELGAVLGESHLFDSGDVGQALGIIEQRTGGEAVLETFAELMIDQIQYMRG